MDTLVMCGTVCLRRLSTIVMVGIKVSDGIQLLDEYMIYCLFVLVLTCQINDKIKSVLG